MVTFPRALDKGVIFQFEEHTTMNKGQFRESTESGIYIGSNFDESAKKPRWAFVVSVGDEVQDKGITVGARVLVEALQWTKGFSLGDDKEKYWKTDEDKILAVDDDV